MRERVCRLELLLVLASAVILGSETLGTHDHILLSQIRVFPFRRLLRLAGLRWRYSTSPPQGSCSPKSTEMIYKDSVRTSQETPRLLVRVVESNDG
jgi:hypothetical protein